MKKINRFRLACIAACVMMFLVVDQGCKKVDENPSTATSSDVSGSKGVNGLLRGYSFVNLTSDAQEYNPLHIDSVLVNAWGLAFGPTAQFGIWVSAAETGVTTVYDNDGNTIHAPINVPFNGNLNGGNPTGQVFNGTNFFIIPSNGQKSGFILATENGTITAAYPGGSSTVTVADRSGAGAVYKGLELAMSNGSWYLYATDFHNARIDVFDQNFNLVSGMQFTDPNIPSGYAPFNVRAFGDMMIVTYAKQLAPDNEDDEAGPGNGYVDVYKTDGTFVQRLASGGTLNSPWGIEMTSMGMRQALLIGNFGDGHINAFDMSGTFLGQLMMGNQPLVIDGLWSISYPPKGVALYADVQNRLYFTAGPDDEEHGVFGYITKGE